MEELVPDIAKSFAALNVRRTLEGWTSAVKFTAAHPAKEIQNAAVFLLVLDPKGFSVDATAYGSHELLEADAEYARLEKEKPELQAVLVSVDSVAALRTAYPNFYADTAAFLAQVQRMISVGRPIKSKI